MNAKLTGLAPLLALLLFTCAALASIEREPLRVDLNNARLKYDIDDLERTRVLAENNQESNQVATAPRPTENTNINGRDDSSHQDAPMISIRRIFLVPVMPSSSSSSSSSSDDNDQAPSDPMKMFGMPQRSLFSPFYAHHLFGGDEASRPKPVNADESQERPIVASAAKPEQEGSRPISAMFDPIEMLMEAMRQALNPANMLPPPEPTDLNKEASGEKKLTSEGSETELVDKKPQSFNSTKEDVVEIDGKKYLRKTVINRHVGDGIMFMTRRLIFSPLNETESTTENKKESSEAPSTEQPIKVEKNDEPATDNSGTVSPAASEPPSTKDPVVAETTPASPQEPSSTTAIVDKEAKKSLGDKIAETAAKVERLMEKMIERKVEPAAPASTEKPSSS